MITVTARAAVVTLAATLTLAGCGSGGSSAKPAATSTAPTPTSTPTPTPTPTPTNMPSQSASAGTRPTTSPRPAPTTTRTATPAPTATTALPAWLRSHVITRLPTTRRVVALTFDGGAGSQGAASILATLAREHVPATFFLTGRFVRDNATTANAIARAGYLIGNHTETHPHLTTLSTAAVTREVAVAAADISAVTGRSPRPWFRFPFGEYDARTLHTVNGLGYGAIGWTVDTKGWLGRSGGTVADVVQRARAALQPGEIVLMHLGANPDDGTTYDANALAAIIAAVRAAGYGFVTVAAGG